MSMYVHLKALHIVFVVTWFAGLFYMPRLFIYATEAGERSPAERDVLRAQFAVMMRRLWYGITWPSAIITLLFGLSLLFHGGWYRVLFTADGLWITLKLGFVVLLYAYHLYLHRIFKEEQRGEYRLTSMRLRVWNEAATVLLVAIVMLAVVKQAMSLVWGLGGLALLIALLLGGIALYRRLRSR